MLKPLHLSVMMLEFYLRDSLRVDQEAEKLLPKASRVNLCSDGDSCVLGRPKRPACHMATVARS